MAGQEKRLGDIETITAVVKESDSGVFVIPKRQTDTGKLRAENKHKQAAHTAVTMEQAYSEADLRTLSFDMGIDYESLPGEEKREKIRAIVGHFYRRNTLQIFIEFLEGDRPNWKWRVDEPKEPIT